MRTARSLVAVAALLAAATACSGSSTPSASPAPPPGPLPGGEVASRARVELGLLPSGADVVTLWANGGVDTRTGTWFDRQGLGFHLVPTDDAVAAVARYLAGETPWLRASWATMAAAYEQVCPSEDVPTCPRLVLGLAWSHDERLVARDDVHTVADLRGRAVALQRGGPQPEALFEALRRAGVPWGEVRIVWKDGMQGPGGPGEAFHADPGLAAAWVPAVEVPTLTRPPEDGSPAAHVLDLPGDLVLDALFVRQDHAAAHPDEVEHVRVAWLHAAAEVRALDGAARDALLGAVASTWGPARVADVEAARALLDGADPIDLAGNVALSGDAPDRLDHVDLSDRSRAFAEAMERPLWRWTIGVAPARWDDAAYADLPASSPAPTLALVLPVAADATAPDPAASGPAFDQALAALQDGGLRVRIRGHVDPQQAFVAALDAAVAGGRLRREGPPDRPTWATDAGPVDVADPRALASVVTLPPDLAREAREVATARAEAVRDALLAHARERGVALDPARVTVEGVGLDEPVVGVTPDPATSARNRRVELVVEPAGAGSGHGW